MKINITTEGIVLEAGLMAIEVDRRIFKIDSEASDSLLRELAHSKTLRYESDTRSVYVYKTPTDEDWKHLEPFVRRGMIGKCYQNNSINIQRCVGDGWVCAVDAEVLTSPRAILALFYKAPSVGQQLKTLSQAFVKAVNTNTLTTFVKPETFSARKSICMSCEYYEPTAFLGTGRCRVCGCGEAKLRMPSQSCPKQKWGVE
jgi:hypothetical protein